MGGDPAPVQPPLQVRYVSLPDEPIEAWSAAYRLGLFDSDDYEFEYDETQGCVVLREAPRCESATPEPKGHSIRSDGPSRRP
jgi:hypothetical protein